MQEMFHLPCHFFGGSLGSDFAPALIFSRFLNSSTPSQMLGLRDQRLSTGAQYRVLGEPLGSPAQRHYSAFPLGG